MMQLKDGEKKNGSLLDHIYIEDMREKLENIPPVSSIWSTGPDKFSIDSAWSRIFGGRWIRNDTNQ